MSPQIPIRNIYYLLCYSWNRLAEGDLVDVSGVDSNELADLFATVLISGVNHLLRRGPERGYERFEEELACVRGRVIVAASARRMLLTHGKAYCAYDNLSVNTQANRIIKATLFRLTRVPTLDSGLRAKLRALHRDLSEIASIRLSRLSFRSVQLHGNSRFYRFLLSVCELIIGSWLVDEADGSYRFRDFLRDEHRMARLYEGFILNFFRSERPELGAKKEKIRWLLTGDRPGDTAYLPQMETDISLRSPSKTLVIDAKYYKETLSSYYDSETVHSAHLYQLFSYVMNLRQNGGPDDNASGMLLYPVVNQRLRLNYEIHGHSISICTVDLGQEWRAIRAELLELVDCRVA